MDAVKVCLNLPFFFHFHYRCLNVKNASQFLKIYLGFHSFFSLLQVDLDAYVVSLKIQLAGQCLQLSISHYTRIIVHRSFF